MPKSSGWRSTPRFAGCSTTCLRLPAGRAFRSGHGSARHSGANGSSDSSSRSRLHSELPAERLKPILEVLDPTPIADAGVLVTLRWAAQYYHHPIGEVLASALPKGLRQGASAVASEERWSASAARGGVAPRGGAAPGAQEATRAAGVIVCGRSRDARHARCALRGSWREAARALAAGAGCASVEVPRDPPAQSAAARAQGPELFAEQHAAVEAVAEQLGAFRAFLLHGITGSGKTEVYLRAGERCSPGARRRSCWCRRSRSPHRSCARFRGRFPGRVAVLHSALSDQRATRRLARASAARRASCWARARRCSRRSRSWG